MAVLGLLWKLLTGDAIQAGEPALASGLTWQLHSVRYLATAREQPPEVWDQAKPVKLGQSLQQQGWPGVGQHGWYALEFSLPPVAETQPLGLVLGRVGNSAEVWLNGRRLTIHGRFTPPAIPTAGTMLVVPLTPAGLRPEQTNFLAVRVGNFSGAGGLLRGPWGVFPAEEAARIKRHSELFRETVRGGTIAICLAWAGLLALWRRAGTEIRELSGSVTPTLLLAGHRLVRSQWLADSDLPLGWVSWWEGFFNLTVPLAFYGYFRGVFPDRRRRTDWLAGAALLLLLGLFSPLRKLGPAPVAGLYGAYLLVLTGAQVWLADRARREGDRRAGPLLHGWLLVAAVNLSQLLPVWCDFIPYAALPLWGSDVVPVVWVLVLGGIALRQTLTAQRQEAQLRARVLTAHEEERRRIGRELHDSVAQDLDAARLRLQLLGRQASPEAAAKVGQIAEELRGSLRAVRGLAHDLQPLALQQTTLIEALKRFAHAGDPPQVEVTGEEPPGLTGPQRENLYRIAQEAVRNARRHAEARVIRVELQAQAGAARLSVSDDGRGFDPREVTPGRLGLRFLRDRAELCGGELRLTSEPGRGTRLEVTCPCAATP